MTFWKKKSKALTVLMQCCPAWKAEHHLRCVLSVIRIPWKQTMGGFYPCGEGAGYAGGITSAAMDGIKVAEAVSKKFRNFLGESVHLSFFYAKMSLHCETQCGGNCLCVSGNKKYLLIMA